MGLPQELVSMTFFVFRTLKKIEKMSNLNLNLMGVGYYNGLNLLYLIQNLIILSLLQKIALILIKKNQLITSQHQKPMKQRLINRIDKWLSTIQDSPKPILKLFLKGIKGRLQITYNRPYNFYVSIGSLVLVFAFAKYLVSFQQNEMNVKGYNWFVPDYVYRVREESHIYWETSRLAKKLPTTFTFYQWDENLMYEIDRNGQQTPFHAHKGLQNTQTFTSPLHQYNFPASAQTHARIMMYLKNLSNPYDLKNYLRYKPITIGDFVRAFYYGIYRQLGLTNRWRYDEYVSKPNFVYQFEKLKYVYLLTRDREMLYKTIDGLMKGEGEVWGWKNFFWVGNEGENRREN